MKSSDKWSIQELFESPSNPDNSYTEQLWIPSEKEDVNNWLEELIRDSPRQIKAVTTWLRGIKCNSIESTGPEVLGLGNLRLRCGQTCEASRI